MNINIFLISKTSSNSEEMQKWIHHLGFENYELPHQNEVSDTANPIAMAAKRCYLSFEPGVNPNITKVRKNWIDYFDNILSSGHGSVLEHSTYSFAIEGVTRVFTSEMNRHRAGWSISEGSLRYIRYDSYIPYWEPISIQENINDDSDLSEKKLKTRQIFKEAFENQYILYKQLEEIWEIDKITNFDKKKKITSMMRRIVGMGASTGGVWTGNIRALRHVLATRCTEHAEEEICYVFTEICKKLVKDEPLLFGDFTIKNGFYQPKYLKV